MNAYHLVIDLDGVRPCPFTKDEAETVERFMNSCVKHIKMNPLTEPIIKHGNPSNPGISGIMMIDTSHISVHTFSYGKQARIDIYSCKPFKTGIVAALIELYFPSDLTEIKPVDRRPVVFPGDANE